MCFSGTFRELLFPFIPLKYMKLPVKIVDIDSLLWYNYIIARKEVVPLSIILLLDF